VVASCGEKELGIAVAEVDLAYMDQIRTNMPVFTHRRSDVYGAILPGQPATASEVEVLATTRRA
jgi:predicted amidohydrolase